MNQQEIRLRCNAQKHWKESNLPLLPEIMTKPRFLKKILCLSRQESVPAFLESI